MSILLTESNFNTVTIDKYVLADFYSPGCFPCKQMSKTMRKLESKVKSDKLVIAKVNVDDNVVLENKYAIEAIPTLILFKDSVEVGRLEGRKEIWEVKNFLKECIEA